MYWPEMAMSRKPVFGLPFLVPTVSLRELFVLPLVYGLSEMSGNLVECRSSDLVATSFEELFVGLSPLD